MGDTQAQEHDPLEGLETTIIRIDPRKIRLLEKNARYMTPAMYARLVANIKRDGCLTQDPCLVPCGEKDGETLYEAISGNHRVSASIDAGLVLIDAKVILTPLTKERRVAIQLSHNAIVGADDANILQELYLEIEDVDLREYTGLADDDFKVEDPSTSGISIGAIGYEEIQILFLPDDAARFRAVLEKLEKNKSASRIIELAKYDDYNKVFDALIKTKQGLRIFNSAVAFRMMAELAMERLAQIEAESTTEKGG